MTFDLEKRIAAIDWAAVPALYPGFPPLPAVLSKLADPKPQIQARACQDLTQALVPYLGYVTPFAPAAAVVAPILLDAVQDPAFPRRGALLELVGNVAVGNHQAHLAQGFRESTFDRSECALGRAVHGLVAERAAEIALLLEDEDEGVRCGAAFVLAFLPRRAPDVIDNLAHRLDVEKKKGARASLAIALGYAAKSAGRADLASLLRTILVEPEPASYGACVGAHLADPLGTDDIDDLLAVAPKKPVVASIPFNKGAIFQLGLSYVLQGADLARGSVSRHEALAAKVSSKLDIDPWLVFILTGNSEGSPRATPFNPVTLDAERKQALIAIAKKLASRPDSAAATFEALWACGVPQHHLGRVLGYDAPKPLDRVVEGAPLWHWLHRSLYEDVSRERWLTLLAGVDAAGALALCEDMASSPLDLNHRIGERKYDYGPLIGAIEQTAKAFGVSSARLDERLASLRANKAPET